MYNAKCKLCGHDVYQGFRKVECSYKPCQNYVAQDEPVEEDDRETLPPLPLGQD